MGLLDGNPISAVSSLLQTAADKIWPDPEKAAAAKVAILQAQQAGQFKEIDNQLQRDLAQIAANAAEAAKPGMHFRDGAGWTCVVGFAIMVLKAPIEWACALSGHPVMLPTVDPTYIMPMLAALLGFGTMHVYQQVKNGG